MQKGGLSMQFDSFIEVFDTMAFSAQRPISPIGSLFTYYPQEKPESLHYHNFFEIGYCEGGSGVFIVDGEIVPFSGKCCSIIYEGQIHIAQSIDPNKSLWHFLYIDLNKLFYGMAGFAPNLLQNFDYRNYTIKNIISYREDPELFDLVRLILGEAADGEEGFFNVVRGLTIALLSKHKRYMRPGNRMRRDKNLQLLDEVGDVLNYINNHFTDNVSIQTLLAVAKTSKASLQRKFLSATGLTPMQYLHQMRLNRASLLLMEGSSVAEIAMDVGYNSLSSFNRRFLAQFGMPPTKWKRIHEER
jgi:AraC-like DNA-binding protein